MQRRKLLNILAELNPKGLQQTLKNTKDQDANELKTQVQNHVNDFSSRDEKIKEKIKKLDEKDDPVV